MGLKAVKARAGEMRKKKSHSSMTVIFRLGLLNQQMAGLASSLAGKTGTFQVFI